MKFVSPKEIIAIKYIYIFERSSWFIPNSVPVYSEIFHQLSVMPVQSPPWMSVENFMTIRPTFSYEHFQQLFKFPEKLLHVDFSSLFLSLKKFRQCKKKNPLKLWFFFLLQLIFYKPTAFTFTFFSPVSLTAFLTRSMWAVL